MSRPDYAFQTYHAGARALLDAFISGLIPCKVLEVIKPGQGNRILDGEIRIQITEDGKGYHKGEVLRHSAYDVVPRDRVYTRGCFLRINTQYEWQ